MYYSNRSYYGPRGYAGRANNTYTRYIKGKAGRRAWKKSWRPRGRRGDTIRGTRETGDQRVDALELKVITTQTINQPILNPDTMNTAMCLNGIGQGTLSHQRLGRTVCLHSVNGIGIVQGLGNYVNRLWYTRVVVVKSLRCNGAAPTWRSIFSSDTINANRNLGTSSLFHVLYDAMIPIVPSSHTVSDSSLHFQGYQVNYPVTFRFLCDLKNTPCNYGDAAVFTVQELRDVGIFFLVAYLCFDENLTPKIEPSSEFSLGTQLFYYDI